jgi:hypothetical protein
MRTSGPQSSRLALGLLAMAALASGGCASAGFMVAGPLFSAAVAIADRSVERTLPADRGTGWSATVDALSRMGVKVHDADRSGETWTLKGTGDKVSVAVSLAPVTAGMSRLSLRVEAGGLTADKKTADEILNQVGATLTAWASGGTGSDGSADRKAATEAISSLKREVERLGTQLEEPRDPERAEGAPARSTPATPTVLDTGGIVVVPTTVAVPSAPAPERPAGLRDPVAAARPVPASPTANTAIAGRDHATTVSSSPAVRPSPVLEPAPRGAEKIGAERDIFPARLDPVGPLSPVEALSAKRVGQ